LKSTNRGRAFIVGAALCWGLAGVCVKSITWSAMSLMGVRSFVAIFLLFAVKGSWKLRFTKENLIAAAMCSTTGILYVLAIMLTTAGTAIVLQYVAPILVFLFAVLFQHRKAKLSEILITAAVFSGIVLSFADSLDPTRTLGNLLGLLSGFSFAAQIIIMNGKTCDSDDTLILSCIISFLICAPFLFTDSSISFDRTNIIWVLILCIVQYSLGNIFFAKGIDETEKVEASLLLTIEPIFNPIPVAIICHEMMGTKALIGSGIVIVFVALYGLLPKLERSRKT